MPPQPFRPKYVLDTSSFLELQERYPRELAPGAWDLLEKLVEARVIASSTEVLEELAARDDSVAKWAKQNSEIFVPLYSDIQTRAKVILADFPTLIDTKKRKSSADPFVIATAELTSAIVVTEENLVGAGHRVQMPNVCRARGIRWMRLKEMFVAENLVLIAK